MSSCRGQPEAGDQTIAAFLRRIRAEDGAPLPELRFWSELSIFFFAGASARSPQPCHYRVLHEQALQDSPSVTSHMTQTVAQWGGCKVLQDGRKPKRLTL